MLSIDSEFYQEMKVFLCCNLKKKERKKKKQCMEYYMASLKENLL